MKRQGSRIMIGTLSALTVLALAAVSGCGNNSSGESVNVAGRLASADGAGDLSGQWVLNKNESEFPFRNGKGMRGDCPDSTKWQMRRDRRQSGECPDSARWGQGHGKGMRGDCPEGMKGDRPMRGQHGARGPMTMTIAQTDSTVEITGMRGFTRLLYTDGRAIAPNHDRAPEGAEVRATWNAEGKLVVEHSGPRGGKRIETFSLSGDGKQLIVAVHHDPAGDREARDFRRVYDAAVSDN